MIGSLFLRRRRHLSDSDVVFGVKKTLVAPFSRLDGGDTLWRSDFDLMASWLTSVFGVRTVKVEEHRMSRASSSGRGGRRFHLFKAMDLNTAKEHFALRLAPRYKFFTENL